MNEQNLLVKHQSTEPDSCEFYPDSLLYPIEIEDCINSIPFDPFYKEITLVISTILEHSQGYAYRDTSFNPPQNYNHQTKDLGVQLEAITPSIFNTPYKFQ